jgi:aromatic ring-opening dioxygenase catalytic subunit (LigB family)
MTHTLPTLYIPHGGGPCFFMDWTMGPANTWDKMAAWLKQLLATLPVRPQALLVISAHWETAQPRLTGHAQPPLIYDYYGFPEHTYQLTYPAPGHPALAKEVHKLLTEAGIPADIDPERGLDHGVFVPFKLIDPEAQIPVIQLSLQAGLDPAQHLAIGRALAPLREQGVLIVGSGMSFHNMRAFGHQAQAPSRIFDDWLTATVTAPEAERTQSLINWSTAPQGQFAHPREEHLLPLMVVAGAAGSDPGSKIFEDEVMDSIVSAFQFGAA